MLRIFQVLCVFGILSISFQGFSQGEDPVQKILGEYETYREEALDSRRFNHEDLQPLIEKYRDHPDFTVRKVGESIEGRDLSLVSIGKGETSVFLWSQMHGDESTATMALFDLFNFFADDSYGPEKEMLLENLSLHFLPMLNPDGAEKFQRRNALGIDVNRDALRLQSPEGRTLKRIRDSLDADWGFNLHDQSKYYNAEGTEKPATISFLAPAYDYEKSINAKRGDAMKLIVEMNRNLQKYIPGQVAKYNDDFEPRAFGDNIQKWGTRTILIESGGQVDDPEKQEIRRMNFLAILSSLVSISEESYREASIDDYAAIPDNDSKLVDLRLTGLNYCLLGEEYKIDLGINRYEAPAPQENKIYYRARVVDQGDLSTNYGYQSFDLSDYRITPGAIYPEVFENIDDLQELDFTEILSNGYSYLRVRNLPEKSFTPHPIIVVKEDFTVPTKVQVGVNPTFFLEKQGKIEFAVINGFVQKLGDSSEQIKNGLILR